MQTNPGILRLFDLLSYGCSRYAGKVAFCSRKGNEWVKTTFQEYQQKSDQVSLALLAIGIKKGDHIITISRNRAEFNFADMGIMQTGAIHVPLYATIDENKLAAVLSETASPVVFTGNEKIYRTVLKLKLSVPTLKKVICFDDVAGGDSFKDFLIKADQHPEPDLLNQIKKEISDTDSSSLTYISGSTTGVKGILHSHSDQVHNALAIAQSTCITHEMNLLSLLPLAHSYERSINYCVQYLGATTWYNTNFKTIEKELKEIKPDVIFMVPFLMQKLFDFLVTGTLPENAMQQSDFRQAICFALENEAGIENPGNASGEKPFYATIYNNFREFMGGNIKMLYCGGASLNQDLRRFFDNCGMTCYEGYGLTEAGPVVAHNSPLSRKAGTVGKTVSDTMLKISADGEVLVKSPSKLKGYFNNPTAEFPVDAEGWLHTGDTGSIDPEGFLTLTGVKKRIFKMSTGIYTDPLTIERKIELNPMIKNAFVFGLNRDFLVAVIRPDFSALRTHFIQSSLPATHIALLQNEVVISFLDECMQQYNSLNRGVENQVKHFFADDTWNTGNGLLNPDGSLNRINLYKKYRERIENMYS